MASERLKELQEMEQRIQKDTNEEEIQPLPKEVNLGAGSFRVADSDETQLEERKQLLRRRLAAKVNLHLLHQHMQLNNHPCACELEMQAA